MGVNLSIKNVPAEKVALLKQRAKANHRSLQGELMAIIDEASQTATPSKMITIDELIEQGQRLGLKTTDEATKWIREDRDSR